MTYVLRKLSGREDAVVAAIFLDQVAKETIFTNQYPKQPPITLATVQRPAILKAFFGIANTIGINIISGGIGKKELSAKATKNKNHIAFLLADNLSI